MKSWTAKLVMLFVFSGLSAVMKVAKERMYLEFDMVTQVILSIFNRTGEDFISGVAGMV
jgi:hypothetical protein